MGRKMKLLESQLEKQQQDLSEGGGVRGEGGGEVRVTREGMDMGEGLVSAQIKALARGSVMIGWSPMYTLT